MGLSSSKELVVDYDNDHKRLPVYVYEVDVSIMGVSVYSYTRDYIERNTFDYIYLRSGMYSHVDNFYIDDERIYVDGYYLELTADQPEESDDEESTEAESDNKQETEQKSDDDVVVLSEQTA